MEIKSDETSWFKFQGQHYERFLFKTRCLIFRVLPEIYGGIAQLGEHLLCKQGVIGSIPIISTSVGQRFEKAFVSGNDSAKQRCKAGQKTGS